MYCSPSRGIDCTRPPAARADLFDEATSRSKGGTPERSMRLPRDDVAAATDEEVQIGAAIGLLDMVEV